MIQHKAIAIRHAMQNPMIAIYEQCYDELFFYRKDNNCQLNILSMMMSQK